MEDAISFNPKWEDDRGNKPKNPVLSSERDFRKQSYSGDRIETINLFGGKDGSLNRTHVGGIKLDLL